MWSLIWTNLNLLYTRMLCAMFGWNWLSGSGKEDFLLYRYHLALEKSMALLWTNLNSVEIGLDENVKSLQTDDRQSKKLTLKRKSDTAIFKTPHGLHIELSISIELSDGRLIDSKPWANVSFSKIHLKIHLMCSFFYIFNLISKLKV